jgi:hypothetical protein
MVTITFLETRFNYRTIGVLHIQCLQVVAVLKQFLFKGNFFPISLFSQVVNQRNGYVEVFVCICK